VKNVAVTILQGSVKWADYILWLQISSTV